MMPLIFLLLVAMPIGLGLSYLFGFGTKEDVFINWLFIIGAYLAILIPFFIFCCKEKPQE